MDISPRRIIAIATFLVLGGFCLWGKDHMLKWDAEIRQSMGQQPPERTAKWERDVTVVGIGCMAWPWCLPSWRSSHNQV